MGKIIRNGIEYGDVSASCISYDNSGGDLISNNVQNAIDEINDKKVDKETGKGLFSGSYNDLTNKPSLATVATSGSYNDLSNKPSLATVATSGSYNDLSNKPTIPAAVAVKGNAESSYRTGNVNLTPANIGALPSSGGTLSGDLSLQTGSNDCPDIVFKYGNGSEKMRIWTDDTYTSALGPNYRVYNTSGTNLYSGRLATVGQIPTNLNQLTNGPGYITGSGTSAYTNYITSNSRMDYGWNGVNYFNADLSAATTVKQNNAPVKGWWHIMRFNHANNAGYYTDLAIPFNNTGIYYKRVCNGSLQNNGWIQVWDTLSLTNLNQLTNGPGYITSSGSTTGSARTLKEGTFTFCSCAGNIGTLQSNGLDVILQTNKNGWNLHQQIDGNLVVYQNNTAKWSSGSSSKRFKHNIQDMTEERAKQILNIRPVTFDWNDDQPITTRQNDNAGVIAEEVSQVIPDLVVYETLEDGTNVERRVEYERFTSYLIKLCQMQQKEIDELKERINKLENQIKE